MPIAPTHFSPTHHAQLSPTTLEFLQSVDVVMKTAAIIKQREAALARQPLLPKQHEVSDEHRQGLANAPKMHTWEHKLYKWINGLDESLSERERPMPRMRRIRQHTANTQNPNRLNSRANKWDHILAHPEHAKHLPQATMVHAAAMCDTAADFCADISGVTERFVRSAISGGNKKDMAMMLASGIGRMVSGFLNFPGFAVHKAAGAGLYCLSSLLSLMGIAMQNRSFGIKRSRLNANQHSRFMEFSTQAWVTKRLMAVKQLAIQKISNSKIYAWPVVKKTIGLLCKNATQTPTTETAHKRKTHSSYMWQNIHEYKGITRGLLLASFGLFHIVNRLGVSLDKYAGNWLNQVVLKSRVGDLLGHRIAMTLMSAAACAISIPLSPLKIGISFTGAIACGVSVVLLMLAKLSVRAFDAHQPSAVRHSDAAYMHLLAAA